MWDEDEDGGMQSVCKMCKRQTNKQPSRKERNIHFQKLCLVPVYVFIFN